MAIKPTIRSHNITDAELEEYASIILKEMTENASLFPHPDPDLKTFETILKDFRKAIADATYRDMLAIRLRNTKREELLDAMRFLSVYVQLVAKGDENIILAAGFIPSKPRGSSENIPLTADFRVIPTIGTGAIKLRVKAWRSARVYQFEYRKKEQKTWTPVISTRSSCTLSGLELLEEYEFRVCYIGRSGKSPYSPVITSRVY